MAGGCSGDSVANTVLQIPLFISGALLFWGVYASSQVVHPARYLPSAIPSDVGLPWESVRFPASDGIPISGWFIRNPAPRGVLILLHGFGTCKADLLDIAQAFHAHGSYHLLLIDFRAHGASGGRIASFGLREVLDVEGALRFLSEEPSLKGFPVGCYGISMGGSIGILAAARAPQIRAVVSDCAYADLGKAIARAVWMSYHIPRIPLGQMVVWATRIRLGCPLRSLSPAEQIGRVSPRGTLIIHGSEDKSVPPESAQVLFEAAGEPKRLWLVSGAEHVASFYRSKEEYLRLIFGFLNDALL